MTSRWCMVWGRPTTRITYWRTNRRNNIRAKLLAFLYKKDMTHLNWLHLVYHGRLPWLGQRPRLLCLLLNCPYLKEVTVFFCSWCAFIRCWKYVVIDRWFCITNHWKRIHYHRGSITERFSTRNFCKNDWSMMTNGRWMKMAGCS